MSITWKVAAFTTGPSQIAFNVKKAFIIVCLSCAAWSVGSAENTYWTEYGTKPVKIEQLGNGKTQTLNFVTFKDDKLVAELEGGVGEVALPVSDAMVKNLRLSIPGLDPAYRLIDAEKYDEALDILRPRIYPLVKFHQVPESFVQLHRPVRGLLNTLIAGEKYDEAMDLFQRIALGKVDQKYSNIAISLMDAYLGTQQYKKAEQIAASLPTVEPYARNISAIMNAAERLRNAGEYEAVIPLYKGIVESVPEQQKKSINMWLAYSLILAERIDEATPLIDGMQEPAADERTYSLYKLLQGSRQYQSKNYTAALDLLTRGFVRAQTSYPWVAEMQYLIGNCYATMDDTIAAQSAWSEIAVLYPNSIWADKAVDALAQLPSAENRAN